MPKYTTQIGGYWEAVWGSVVGSVVFATFAQILYFVCESVTKIVFNNSIADIYLKLFFAVDNIIWAAIIFLIFLAFLIAFIGLYFFSRAIGCRCALAWKRFPGAKLTSKYLLRFDLFLITIYFCSVFILTVQSLLGAIHPGSGLQVYYFITYIMASFFIPPFLARCWSNIKGQQFATSKQLEV